MLRSSVGKVLELYMLPYLFEKVILRSMFFLLIGISFFWDELKLQHPKNPNPAVGIQVFFWGIQISNQILWDFLWDSNIQAFFVGFFVFFCGFDSNSNIIHFRLFMALPSYNCDIYIYVVDCHTYILFINSGRKSEKKNRWWNKVRWAPKSIVTSGVISLHLFQGEITNP